jgi:hypothetical protein
MIINLMNKVKENFKKGGETTSVFQSQNVQCINDPVDLVDFSNLDHNI